MLPRMDLQEIIINRIKEEGPISFHDFMEMALYYPGLGYYTSDRDKFGRQGDYFTSSCLSPVMGMVLGKQIEEMWRQLGRADFTIVEYGAGNGFLCHDILTYLCANKQLYSRLRYCIIEKSSFMRNRQRAHLPDKVIWYNSIEAIEHLTGCIISNELVDNFAVHRVVMQDELQEVFLDYQDGFVETLRPASTALTGYFRELEVALPRGFQTEINLEATQWIGAIGAALQKGYVITIDYGYASAELYRNSRRAGTLLCYHQHQINDDPYRAIGRQDITTHINFSALSHWGFKNGLAPLGLVSQAAFLLALDFKACLRKTLAAGENKLKAALQEAQLTRTLLLDMGLRFKVLIQHKGMGGRPLSGLAFASFGS